MLDLFTLTVDVNVRKDATLSAGLVDSMKE